MIFHTGRDSACTERSACAISSRLDVGMCMTTGDRHAPDHALHAWQGGPVCAREEAERLQRTVLLELGRLPQQ